MRPVLVVAAIVHDARGRVLLTRRPDGVHLAGLWEFPGGKLRDGEAPEAGLARELREEIGVEARALRIFDVTHHRYPEKDVLLLFYEAAIVRGTPRDLECAAHAWVPPARLDRHAFPPADARVVERLRSESGRAVRSRARSPRRRSG